MPGIVSPLMLVTCALLLAAGCVRERERPPALVEPDESSPSAPLVWITAPAHGATLPRELFSRPPGVQVTYAGSYTPGHLIDIEGFALQYSNAPFASVQILVGPADPPGFVFLTGNAQYFLDATQVVIVLRVFDAGQAFLTADSVTVSLR